MSLHRTKDELFAIVSPQPSFLTGAASVLDLGGTLTRFYLDETSDAIALQSDWQAVGDVLRSTIAAAEEPLSETQMLMAKKVQPPATRPSQQPTRADKPAIGSVTVTHSVTSTQVTGPIPAPEILEKYNQVEPGLANRIVAMAEAQLAHRIQTEGKIVDGALANQRGGRWSAFLLTAGTIAGGVWLVGTGHDSAGAVAIIGSIAGVITVYLKGRQSGQQQPGTAPQNKELPAREEKPE